MGSGQGYWMDQENDAVYQSQVKKQAALIEQLQGLPKTKLLEDLIQLREDLTFLDNEVPMTKFQRERTQRSLQFVKSLLTLKDK